MAANEARVFFALSGYMFDPEAVTQVLEIEPTSTNSTGAHGQVDRPSISSWELSSEKVVDEVDIYKLTEELIKTLMPHKDKIMSVIETYNLSPRISVELLISVDKDENAPDVGLGSRSIKFLSEIGAFINIDYKLSQRI